MEDTELSASMNLQDSLRVPEYSIMSAPVGVDEQRAVRRKFNRFDRKSIFTIVQMSKDPR